MSNYERDYDGERKKRQREDSRTIVIPPPEDIERRRRLEQDDIAWLMWYFGPGCGLKDEDCFTREFTEQQIEMAGDLARAFSQGGDKATAASRGEGKTTICERIAIKYTLSGEVDFVLLCCATGTLAESGLESIRGAIEDNERLRSDYPEVCIPVMELEGVPQRAKTQLATGKRLDNGEEFERAKMRYSWTGAEVVLPNVPGSPSANAVIATRGLDSAVRGIKRKGKRVKVVIIDDPDTRDTARSEEQARLLADRIDKDLAGLGTQTRSVARVMLTTLQSRTSASFLFTDQKKSLRGLAAAIASWFIGRIGPICGTNTSGYAFMTSRLEMRTHELLSNTTARIEKRWTTELSYRTPTALTPPSPMTDCLKSSRRLSTTTTVWPTSALTLSLVSSTTIHPRKARNSRATSLHKPSSGKPAASLAASFRPAAPS